MSKLQDAFDAKMEVKLSILKQEKARKETLSAIPELEDAKEAMNRATANYIAVKKRMAPKEPCDDDSEETADRLAEAHRSLIKAYLAATPAERDGVYTTKSNKVLFSLYLKTGIVE